MTKVRRTRTSSSEPAAGRTGPKRPGTPAADPSGPQSGEADAPAARTRTRTRKGSTKPVAPAKSTGGDPISSRRARSKRGGTPSAGKSSSKQRSAAPKAKAKPAANPVATPVVAPIVDPLADPVSDPAADPTTEITDLDQDPTTGEPRQRSGSGPRSDDRVVTTPGPDQIVHDDELDQDPPPRRSRTVAPVRRGRRVKRVIRRIELWSVLKLAIVLYTCMYLAILLTMAVLWGLAYSTGQIENIETFMGEVGLGNYRFYGDRMFKAVAAIGAVLVLAGTVLTVLWAALVNIISEITGGIRVVVIEEEPIRPSR